ncbi:trehalose-phosphatase [Sphingomonas sp. H39-1-10]|uniref:trehalose-phosphatase n=1 Tax=Sphingomonas TaxID=13687 RepID=UPI000881E15B|nr:MULTISPECIES: trehalose-phosphatase [Sphingomonas]MDF0489810.1 trehalose-phosphatase [Sphingomonas pollutisoli]SDA31705.1 trehalose 6-phosphatase [Sphingomonas sp. NFR15]
MSAATDAVILPAPPPTLLESASLFLDFDGTLVDLADRPDGVSVDAGLTDLLAGLARRLDGRVAIVSGRSLAQLDALLGPVARTLALSGSHGCEHRWHGATARPERPDSLDHVAEAMHAAAAGQDGVIVEEKSFGVALHYRLAPGFGAEALSLAERLAAHHDLAIQHGKMMIELRVPGSDKGVAVARLMERPDMAGTRPIFIGDDLTDEPAFVAARDSGGHAILVGEPRASAADYGLPDPAAVRAWLLEEHA